MMTVENIPWNMSVWNVIHIWWEIDKKSFPFGSFAASERFINLFVIAVMQNVSSVFHYFLVTQRMADQSQTSTGLCIVD